MKDEQIKKAFKAGFEQKAPANFTNSVIDKIEHSAVQYESILPAWVFWFMGLGFIALLIVLIMQQPSGEIPFSMQAYQDLFSNVLAIFIFILPLFTLLFLRNILHYRQVSKS